LVGQGSIFVEFDSVVTASQVFSFFFVSFDVFLLMMDEMKIFYFLISHIISTNIHIYFIKKINKNQINKFKKI